MKLKTLTNKQIKEVPEANALTLDVIEAGEIVEVIGEAIKDGRGVDWYKLGNGYISAMFCDVLDDKKSDNTKQDKTAQHAERGEAAISETSKTEKASE